MELSRRELLAAGLGGLVAAGVPASTAKAKSVKAPLQQMVGRAKRDPVLYPTGFPTLDEQMGGGFRRGELMVVIGRHGCGRSAFCHAIAEHQNKVAGYDCVSGPMKESEGGSYDFVHLWQEDFSHFERRSSTMGTVELDKRDFCGERPNYENIHKLREAMCVSGVTTIMSIPSIVPSLKNDDIIMESIDLIRPADYVVHIEKGGYASTVRLLKNRWGPRLRSFKMWCGVGGAQEVTL